MTQPRLTTEILNRFAAGDASLESELVERVHGELRSLARAQLARGRGGRTLQPTALVHEAWLRLVQADEVAFEGRRQFYRYAGRLMRNLLIDAGRSARTERRDDGVSIGGFADEGGATELIDALDLAEALERLEEHDAELARVVELRFLCGLTNAEVGAVLDRTERTVERRWRFARAWLAGELQRDDR